MLCQTCLVAIKAVESLYSIPRTEYEGTPIHGIHHRTWRDLQEAVKLGCYPCCRLKWCIPAEIWSFWREISDGDEGAHPLRWTIDGIRYPSVALPMPAFRLSIKGNLEEFGLEKFGLSKGGVVTLMFRGKEETTTTTASVLDLAPNVSAGHLTSSSTIKGLVQARDWFERCRSSHDKCQQLQSTVIDYPDLLLDLTPSGKNDLSWRLCYPKKDYIVGDYMTLSHRWSDGNITKLTSVTEPDMKRGQPRSLLYQVYQDAMNIADYLGVRYLWIDSLCIFQDTRLDIKKAAQEMDKVYGNGVCNISALSGSTASIFRERPDVLIDPQSLHVSANFHSSNFSYGIKDEEILSDALRYQPLSKRGWIYQEQVLAKRTLYFGNAQVLWNCSSGTACELIPDILMWSIGSRPGEYSFSGLREVNYAALVANRNRSDNPNLKTSTPTLSHSELSHIWDRVVTSYSNRDLTFNEDRLLAIAGISKLFADASQDTYLAGLWKSGLPRQLIWSASDTSCRVSSKYRAPSWSWASIDGPISFEITTPKSVSTTRIFEAQVHYDPVNPFDNVTGGHLILEAPYFEVRLSELKTIIPRVSDPAFNRTNTIIVFDDIHEKRDSSLAGVAVCIQITHFRAGGGTLHGMLLEPCSNQSSSIGIYDNSGNMIKQYKRVGMFKKVLRSESSLPPFFDELLRLVRDPGPDLEATFDLGKVHTLGQFCIV